MRNGKCDYWKRLKLTLLTSLTAGILLASACSVTDVRHNVVAGTQSFIRGYATDLLQALIPPPGDFIGGK